MSKPDVSRSRLHDVFGSVLGVCAFAMLISSPWQVDTTGPDPFYKGPLIFPLIVFLLVIAGSLPSIWRLIRPRRQSSWYLDGYGIPAKGILMLGLLATYLVGVVTIGMEVATWLFLVISMKIVGQDSILKITVFPLLITLILYLVFKLLLDIWFPEPLIVTWLWE